MAGRSSPQTHKKQPLIPQTTMITTGLPTKLTLMMTMTAPLMRQITTTGDDDDAAEADDDDGRGGGGDDDDDE